MGAIALSWAFCFVLLFHLEKDFCIAFSGAFWQRVGRAREATIAGESPDWIPEAFGF